MTSDTILLDQVLRPSPPLKPSVLLWILGIVLAINIVFALSFVLRGAWPIAPFLGLDVALLAWAFRASTVAARKEERITLTPAELSVARAFPKSPRREWRFNPYWVRVQIEEPLGQASQLTLWSHGKFLLIGQFLCPEERAKFAQTLKIALQTARETAA